MYPQEQASIRMALRSRQGREGMNHPISESGLLIRSHDPNSLSVGLQTSQEGVPSGVETEAAEVEVSLGGWEWSGRDHGTAVGFIAAHL
jgi:hypothetical protein